MKRKHLLVFGLIAAMAVSMLAGCGSSKDAAQTSAADETIAVSAEVEDVSSEETTDGIMMVSKNGSMTIWVPDATWQETPSDDACVAFSNGCDAIQMDHYIRGQETPETMDSEEGLFYERVIYDDTYIITIIGYANSEETLPDVTKAVDSAQVDVTKLDAEDAAAEAAEGDSQTAAAMVAETSTKSGDTKTTHSVDTTANYSITDVNYTKYVAAATLNIRSEGSTNATVLGSLKLNDAVTVTGEVMKNGVSTGWVRISYNGVSGYVSSTYLANAKQTVTTTGSSKTLYDSAGNKVVLYQYNDGTWKNTAGTAFVMASATQWKSTDGKTVLYTSVASGGAYATGETHTAYTEAGTPVTLYYYSDGCYRTASGEKYTGIADGCLQGTSGTKLYDYVYIPSTYNSNTGTFYASGTGPYIAIYSIPNGDESYLVGQMAVGDSFTVTDTSNGSYWYGYTSSGVYGYVNSYYLSR